jgi:hypothetical protein
LIIFLIFLTLSFIPRSQNKAASILKIAGLKFWIGRNWSKSFFSKGLEALSPVAVKFLGPKQLENNELPISRQTDTNSTAFIESPIINSPKSANYFFHKIFFFRMKMKWK